MRCSPGKKKKPDCEIPSPRRSAPRGSAASGEPIRLLLGVGVLGGFTTFSAFSLETMLMIERGQAAMAMGYAVASVIGAVGALALGLTIMRSAAA